MESELKKWQWWVLSVIALMFVAATSVLTITNRRAGSLRVARFDWPDEMATAYFVERITDGLPIASRDETIALTANRLHPRSMNVLDSALVPGGFLGFPILLGLLGIWFGYAATFLVTPLLAVLAVFSLRSIVRRVFDDATAWWTSLLAFTNPALLYYASYAMLPNVAFVSLALTGAALALTSRRRFLGGLLVGLALFVRPNEIIWLLPLLALIVWRNPWMPLAGLILGFAPTFLANAAVFGHPLATGYHRFVEATASAISPLEFSGSWFLPFGLNLRLVATNVWHSALGLFWWIVIPAGVGVVLSWKKQRHYVLVALAVGVWLALYYGSWPFTDVEILSLNTIGRSYVRYWLPAFLLFLPFVAVAIRRLGRSASVVTVLVMTILSIRLVYWVRPESILPVAGRIREYHALCRLVERSTGPHDAIITWRTDKIIFPERRVAETDLSHGLDPVLAHAVMQASPPVWYVFAKLSDDQRRALESSLSGATLGRVIGFPDNGPALYAIH